MSPDPSHPVAAPRRRATIKEVAEAAGVSRSTASRALGGNGYVAEPVRARVRLAAKKLGYVVDATARSLKQQSSRLIGVVVSDLKNPFYAGLASGAAQAARSAGYTTVLIDDRDGGSDESYAAEALVALRVAGIVGTPVSDAARDLRARTRHPGGRGGPAVRARPRHRGRRRQPRRGPVGDRAPARPRAPPDRAAHRRDGVDDGARAIRGVLRRAAGAAALPIETGSWSRRAGTRRTPAAPANELLGGGQIGRRRCSPPTTCSPRAPGAPRTIGPCGSRRTSHWSHSTTPRGCRWSSPASRRWSRTPGPSASAAVEAVLARMREPRLGTDDGDRAHPHRPSGIDGRPARLTASAPERGT